MKKKVAFHTLGCKINIFDSEVLMDEFEQHGYLVTTEVDTADIVIINSCTVTAKADSKFKYLINKTRKNNPNAIIAAIGCYTELHPQKAASIAGVDIVLGTNNKSRLIDYIKKIETKLEAPIIVSEHDKADSYEFKDYHLRKYDHTRAFLKIQDGCDNHCTYCTIPQARGRSRSKSVDSIKKDIQNLAENGYKEIIVSGISLGDYRYTDNNGKKYNLADVLRVILQIEGFRLRIGSIEPWCIDEDLISLLVSEERICSQFHIPLQAASDKILKTMNRKYTIAEFDKMINKLSQKKDVMISTDIIVGFPGEEDSDFESSLNYLTQSPLTYAHVFSYSDRPLAASTKLKDKSDSLKTKERSSILRKASDKKKMNFFEKNIGKKFKVVVEGKTAGFFHGFTGNYISVKFKSSDLIKRGELVLVKLTEIKDNTVFAEKLTI